MLFANFNCAFLIAGNVTISGTDGALPQTPLMDTFDEYTQDSWTYDGRYSPLLNVYDVLCKQQPLGVIVC